MHKHSSGSPFKLITSCSLLRTEHHIHVNKEVAENNCPNTTQSLHKMQLQRDYTKPIGHAWIHPYLVNTEGDCALRPKTVHHGTAGHGTQHLGHHVEEGPEETDLAGGQQAQRDGGVQVGAAHVAYALRQRGDGQTEGERHF